MAISYVSSTSANAATVTVSSVQVGDLIVVLAFRSNATIPSLPAGWTSLAISGGRLGYKIATTAGAQSIGTWTNAQYVAGRLCVLGLGVRATVASPDDGDQLEAALRFAASRADVVVCSGGLGPTEDDVNRDVFARVFAAPLRTDAEAVRMMEARFARRGL